MSNRDIKSLDARQFGVVLTVAMAAAVSVIGAGSLLLTRYGPGNMGRGFAVGGGVMTLAMLVAAIRVRHTQKSTLAERALTGTGDEREQRITERALALLGLVSVPLVGVAACAIAIGAAPDMTLALLLWALLAVLVLAHVTYAKRS